VRIQTITVDGEGQPAILWRDYLNGTNSLQPLTIRYRGQPANGR
jgi:hypothetical protein